MPYSPWCNWVEGQLNDDKLFKKKNTAFYRFDWNILSKILRNYGIKGHIQGSIITEVLHCDKHNWWADKHIKNNRHMSGLCALTSNFQQRRPGKEMSFMFFCEGQPVAVLRCASQSSNSEPFCVCVVNFTNKCPRSRWHSHSRSICAVWLPDLFLGQKWLNRLSVGVALNFVLNLETIEKINKA